LLDNPQVGALTKNWLLTGRSRGVTDPSEFNVMPGIVPGDMKTQQLLKELGRYYSNMPQIEPPQILMPSAMSPFLDKLPRKQY
jgi:hypothetical protein